MNKPIRFTGYDAFDRIAAQGAEPTEWINVYAVDGRVVFGPVIHESRALAGVYFHVDADAAGLDIEADGFVWIGAVEYVAEEGDDE